MQKQKTYLYKITDYDINGRNIHNPEQLFTDRIKQFEKDFIEKNSKQFPANYLFASHSTMRLIERCFVLEENETFGMDLINDKIDIDTNLKIEKFSKNNTIYAIGSLTDKNEPLYLIIKNRLSDNKVILKYISHDNDESEEFDFTPFIDKKKKLNIL